MRVPVLTYHSTNISGNDYHNNDHVALQQDLMLIFSLGYEILSAHDLVKWITGETTLNPSKKYTVLTFDDGCELDFIDWKHPTFGFQIGFQQIFNEFSEYIHATSFVIASAIARKTLETTCLAGHSIWGDNWWQQAQHSGRISIENHSWDHLHPTLEHVAQTDNAKGDFTKVQTLADASQQIAQASDYINSQIKNQKTSLFAYPYGHYNRYLTEAYFPTQQNTITAAFSCDAEAATQNSNRWCIPRFVCGDDWKSIADLENILESNQST